MRSRSVIHHDHRLDEAVALVLSRERVKRLRECGHPWSGRYAVENPWTQRRAAARLGISPACLCHWESGLGFPATLRSWEFWAALFHMRLGDILNQVRDE